MPKPYADRLRGDWKWQVATRATKLLKLAQRWKAPERTVEPMGGPMEFWYRPWRGDVSKRRVQPIAIWHGSTDSKPENQWFLRARNLDRNQDDDFALLDMLGDGKLGDVSQASLEEAVLETQKMCTDMMLAAAAALWNASQEHPDGRSGLIPIETAQDFCERVAKAMGAIDLSDIAPKLAEATRSRADRVIGD